MLDIGEGFASASIGVAAPAHMNWRAGITIGMISTMALAPALPVSAQVSAAQASELRAEIVRTESLRVIVTVSIPGVQASESGAAPKASQQQVLRALEGTEHQVVFVFPSTPILALIVGPGALNVLLSHPLVTSITIDRPRKPSALQPQ